MTMRITSIKDRGDIDKERIVMSVEKEVDVGSFLMLQTGVRNDSPTTGVRKTFWFSDQTASKGDLVVLYSKKGAKKQKQNPSGITTHFFYWGESASLWSGIDRAAVLVEADSWQGFTPDDF